jgi:hypothetical protein
MLDLFGGEISIAGIGKLIKEVVEAGEKLNELSGITGSSVEQLSRLQNIVKIGGADISAFRANIERLASGIHQGEEDFSKTARALQFLGITTKDPAQAMEEMAKKLDKFADSSSKAAFARDAFGKQGPEFLSSLHDIATASDVAATTTKEQAKRADELADASRKLTNQMTLLHDVILDKVVPALANAIEQFTTGTKIAGGFFEAIKLFGTLNPFDTPEEGLKKLRFQLDLLEISKKRQTPFGALIDKLDQQRGNGGIDKQIEDRKKQIAFLELLQRQKIPINPEDTNPRDIIMARKPDLGYESTIPGAAVAALHAGIKAIEFDVQSEQQVFTARQDFLRKYYDQDLISIDEFYEKRVTTIRQATETSVSALDAELERMRAFVPEDAKERSEINAEISGKEAERLKILIEASKQEGVIYLERLDTQRKYSRAQRDLAVQLQELQGDTVGAGVAKLRLEQEDLRRHLAVNNDTVGLQNADAILALQENQLKLNKATTDYGLIVDAAGLAQKRLDIAVQGGTLTTLEALQRKSDLNRALIPIYEAQYALVAKLAEASGNPAAILNAERLKVEIEALGTQTDLVAKKFNDLFAGALTDALTDLASGTKSLKDVLKDLEKSLVSSINRIAAQQISEGLFKKGGSLEGLGGFFRDIFGKGTGGFGGATPPIFPEGAVPTVGGGGYGMNDRSLGTSAGGNEGFTGLLKSIFGFGGGKSAVGDLGLTALGTASNVTTVSIDALAIAARTASAALLSIGNSSGGGGLGGLFGSGDDFTGDAGGGGFGTGADFGNLDFGGFLAGGGDPPMGKVSIVGERGPELFVPRSAGTIIPNHLLRAKSGGNHITVNISGVGNASSASANQIAQQTGREIRRALMRQ